MFGLIGCFGSFRASGIDDGFANGSVIVLFVCITLSNVLVMTVYQ